MYVVDAVELCERGVIIQPRVDDGADLFDGHLGDGVVELGREADDVALAARGARDEEVVVCDGAVLASRAWKSLSKTTVSE